MTALRLVAGQPPSGDTELDDYLRWAADLRGLRPNTLRVREELLRRLVAHIGKPLREATEADLLRWEQEAISGRQPETRRAYVSHAKAFYRWAVETGLIGADPSSRLTNPRLSRPLPRPMPEDVLRQAVALARPKMRLMILLGAFCGLRCQEIAGLHWTDLRATVDPATDSRSVSHTLLVREGKGGKERVVPVPTIVIEAVIAYGRRRSGPMFYGQDGAQMDPKSVSCSLNRMFRRNGLDVTAHQLRHRYGTTAYQLTKDLRLVQEMLGHGSPNTTARYAAYDQTQTVDMVQAMDEAWADGESAAGEPSTAELEEVAEALGDDELADDEHGREDRPLDVGRTERAPTPVTEPAAVRAEAAPASSTLDEQMIRDAYAYRLLQAESLLRDAGFARRDDGSWAPPAERGVR